MTGHNTLQELTSPTKVTVRPDGVPQRYIYPDGSRGDNIDSFNSIIDVVRAESVNLDSLARAILLSGLSLDTIRFRSDLLAQAIFKERLDILKLLLSILGWDFTAINPDLNVSVAHFAATIPGIPFLYYILLASDNPRELLNLRAPNGVSLIEQMQLYQHPLFAYLDALVNADYPKVWFSKFEGGPPVMDCKVVAADFPSLKGHTDLGKAFCFDEDHFSATAVEASRYLLPGKNPLENIFHEIGNSESQKSFRIDLVGGFFGGLIQNKVDVAHFAEYKMVYNPLLPGEQSETVDGYIQSIQNKWRSIPSGMEAEFESCIDNRNRTACVTLAIQPYHPRALTARMQPLCDFLENGLLVVTAGNLGRKFVDEVNLLTMNFGCTVKQLRHRLIATRLDYSENPGELLFLSYHNYGPTSYAMATTSFQSANCTKHPLCVSFGDFSYGTSYAAPQLLGVVMQVESVLRLNNVTYTADTVVDILDQGCVKITKPHLAKCLVDPPRVFEAAVQYTQAHKPAPLRKKQSSHKLKKAPSNKKSNAPQEVSDNHLMNAVESGTYSGVSNGVIRSAANFVRQHSQQNGYGAVATEAHAQALMFGLLFALKMATDQEAITAAVETLTFLTAQSLFYGCASGCRHLSQSAADKHYKKLSKGMSMFAKLVEVAPMAGTLSDPIAGITGMVVGSITEKLCDYGLLANKSQKEKNAQAHGKRHGPSSAKKMR